MARTLHPVIHMRNPLRHTSRAGISLVELMWVIVIIGFLVAFMLPKLGPAYDHAMVRSARTAVTNLYNTSRTAARASNQVAVLRLSQNVLWIELNNFFPLTTKVPVTAGGRFHDLEEQYGVTVTGPDSVRVDSRGILIPTNGSPPPYIWVISRDGWSDSIMVNGYGRMVR